MSDTFSEREKAFENKFKLDEEHAFKLHARATKLLGRWAAEKLGLSGEALEAYALELVDLEMEEASGVDALQKVQDDLKEKGVDVTAHHVNNQFNVCIEQARETLMKAS